MEQSTDIVGTVVAGRAVERVEAGGREGVVVGRGAGAHHHHLVARRRRADGHRAVRQLRRNGTLRATGTLPLLLACNLCWGYMALLLHNLLKIKTFFFAIR